MSAESSRLQELVDAGDLDGLLAVVSLADVADAWWRSKLPRADDDPDWWATELWLGGGPIWKREDLVREGIRQLADRMPEGADVRLLAAGPVEDCVIDDDDRLRWIEFEAAESPTFRAALATVWIEDLGAAVFLRVQRAAGVELVWHVAHGPRPTPDGGSIDPELGRSTT